MSQITPEEAELLEHENRFLKNTIISLREELTNQISETQDLLQNKTAEFQQEREFFKKTIEQQRQDIEQSLLDNEKEKTRTNQEIF